MTASLTEQVEENVLSAVYDDPEINAMYHIKTALMPLDRKARERVLQWVTDCLNVTVEFIARTEND